MARLRDLDLGDGRVVPASALSVRFARSGGPGGQHVNRTETKVDLRCDLAASELGDAVVARIRERLAGRLDGDGRVQVVCEESRSQSQNLGLAIERLEALLLEACRPQRKRRATRPTRGSTERRLDAKRRRSETKRRRRDLD